MKKVLPVTCLFLMAWGCPLACTQAGDVGSSGDTGRDTMGTGGGGPSGGSDSSTGASSNSGGDDMGGAIGGGGDEGTGGGAIEPPLPDPLLPLLDVVLGRVEGQLNDFAASHGPGPGDRYFCYTDLDGVWEQEDVQSWCSGFLPGVFWFASSLRDSASLRQEAADWTEDVAEVAGGPDNDTGFQIYGSSGLGLVHSTTSADFTAYEDTVLQGAASLMSQRYNATIGSFRSWPGEQTDPYVVSSQVGATTGNRFEVNIDMLMNMELLLRAAQILEARGQDALAESYVAAAESHFDNTWRDLMREDGSTIHVVQYGPEGQVLNKRTHQGYTDDSTWSRGQAWAVYGHAMFYRYQPQAKWLNRARIAADYYIAQTATDPIPPSDFDQPSGATPRDTSAAAIVCSAFVEMSQQHAAPEAASYLGEAQRALTALMSDDVLLSGPPGQESLLWGCTEKYGEPELGCIFGDYYFLECASRYLAISE